MKQKDIVRLKHVVYTVSGYLEYTMWNTPILQIKWCIFVGFFKNKERKKMHGMNNIKYVE
jgi:hypothetical protein